MNFDGYYLAKFIELGKNINEVLIDKYREFLEPLIDGSNLFIFDEEDFYVISKPNTGSPIYILSNNKEIAKSTLEKNLGCTLNEVNINKSK